MTSKAFTFSRANALKVLFKQSNHFLIAMSPSLELLHFCMEATGVAMAQKFTSTYIDLDSNPDIALFHNIKHGSIAMNKGFGPE